MTRVFEVQIQSPMSYASVALRDYYWAGYKSWHIKFYRMQAYGCGISYYKFVKGAEPKAKTVTSPLIIPSELAVRAFNR